MSAPALALRRLSFAGVGLALLLAAMVLAACQSAPAVTPTPLPTPTASPTPAPTALPAGPAGVVLAAVLERAEDRQQAAQSFEMLMGVPVPGGESIVFRWQDSFSGVAVSCTGLAGVTVDAAGAAALQAISGGCGDPGRRGPLTVFKTSGLDPAGAAATILYGERLDFVIVAIRVFYEGGETAALIGGGGWQAFLPEVATGIEVLGYDSAANVLFQGLPE